MFQRSTCIRVVVASFIVCLVAGTGIAQSGGVFDLIENLPEGYDWKYNPNNGHVYAYERVSGTWSEVRLMVSFIDRGVHLVTITSQQENDWITSTFRDYFRDAADAACYIGLWYEMLHRESQWSWVNGEDFEYENFYQIGGLDSHGTGMCMWTDPNTEYYGKWGSADNKTFYRCFIIEIDDPNVPTPTPTLTPTPTYTPTPTLSLPEGYDWKYNPDNGHYYAYVNEYKSWDDAKAFCESRGGYLVTLTTKEEMEWFEKVFASTVPDYVNTEWWTGYHFVDSKLVWVTGESSNDFQISYKTYRSPADYRTKSAITVFQQSFFAMYKDHTSPFFIEMDAELTSVKGLVGYWNFNEGQMSGNVVHDSSGNGIDGTLNGAIWGEGYVYGGIYFDGEDDYVTLSDDPRISDLSDAYTITFWVNIDELRDYNGVYRRAYNPGSFDANIEIYFSANVLTLVHNRESPDLGFGTYWPLIDPIEWHHVAVTWSFRNGWKVYYDGVIQEPTRYLGSHANPEKGGFSYIGTAFGGEVYGNDHFGGFIDEFKIFDSELTQEQVLLVYEDLSVPTPTPIITPTPIVTLTPTPTPENWSSLNGATLEDNLLVAGAPAGYTQGKVNMTSIPEGDGSDGIGMEIQLAPGQGAFISSLKEFDSPSLMHLSGQFKASNKEAAIALVGLNSPIDGQIGYTNVRSDEIHVDDYRQFNLIYAPPSGKVQYAIQAVNNPFSTISSTVWVDNIRVEPFEPIVGGEPVTLQVDGKFEGGLEELLVNINNDDGTVLPFFESITDIAIRMSLDPSNIAANLGTICLNLADQFPFRLLGQVSVKRDSLPGGGMTAMVLTNGYQNVGVFRKTDDLLDVNSVQDELLIIGGDFTVNNQDIPISVFVQVGGPGAEVSVVVDDLTVLKKGI